MPPPGTKLQSGFAAGGSEKIPCSRSNNPYHCPSILPKWGFFQVVRFRGKATKHKEDEPEYENRVNANNAFASNYPSEKHFTII